MEQKQRAGKKVTQIKKAMINNRLAKQRNHDNDDNDKSQDTQSNSEADPDQINNLNLE